MSETKDEDLLKIQVVSEHCHTIFSAKSSLIVGALIGFLILFYTLLYSGTFSPLTFWLCFFGFSGICVYFIRKISKEHSTALESISGMIDEVTKGEKLPSLIQLLNSDNNRENDENQEKNEKKRQPINVHSDAGRATLNKKSHAQRFDEVFRIILVVTTILLKFFLDNSSSNEQKAVYIGVFSATMVLWIIGHLEGGENEYVFKVYSLYASMLFAFGLFPTFFETLYVTSIFQMPLIILLVLIIALLLEVVSILFVNYLKEEIKNRWRIILVLATFTIIYIATVFVAWYV